MTANDDYFEKKIILLVLHKTPQFGNCYDLIRVLNRMFGIFDPNDLIKELVQLNLITQSELLPNGTHNYSITAQGVSMLSDDFEEFVEELYKQFPDSKDFISAVVNR